MSGKWVPRVPEAADEANGRLPGCHHVRLRAEPRRSHDLVAGNADLGRFFQGGPGHDASGAQDHPVGLGDLDPQPGRPLVEPRRWHGQVLHRKAVVGGLDVQHGDRFPASVVVLVDMHHLQALEGLHAAHPLADEPDQLCSYSRS